MYAIRSYYDREVIRLARGQVTNRYLLGRPLFVCHRHSADIVHGVAGKGWGVRVGLGSTRVSTVAHLVLVGRGIGGVIVISRRHPGDLDRVRLRTGSRNNIGGQHWCWRDIVSIPVRSDRIIEMAVDGIASYNFV